MNQTMKRNITEMALVTLEERLLSMANEQAELKILYKKGEQHRLYHEGKEEGIRTALSLIKFYSKL